jgi:hypothetical protein
MNLGQARVVDPVLSQHARGYRQPGLVGRFLFPLAPVPTYGGQIITFGKEAFRSYNSKRAPGAATKRIDFGYQGEPFAIVPSALEAKVPRELMRDAAQVPGINLSSRAVNTVMRALWLEHEVACAALATNPANYDVAHKTALVGVARWTNAASDPSKDIEAGKEAIRATIGVYPNTCVISAKAMAALRYNAKILDRVQHVSITSVTVDLLKTLWGIPNIVVGEAVVAVDPNDAFGDVWGPDVVLSYASMGGDANANVEEPSGGYTYYIEGHPMVEQPYWDSNAKSWIYGVSFDNRPVQSAQTAMYLIEDAGL